MRAGTMRHHLEVYKREPTDAGTTTETFVKSLKAAKRTARGTERLRDGALRSDKAVLWLTYYTTGIEEYMVMRDRLGEEYVVTSVTDQAGAARNLEIMTTQRT